MTISASPPNPPPNDSTPTSANAANEQVVARHWLNAVLKRMIWWEHVSFFLPSCLMPIAIGYPPWSRVLNKQIEYAIPICLFVTGAQQLLLIARGVQLRRKQSNVAITSRLWMIVLLGILVVSFITTWNIGFVSLVESWDKTDYARHAHIGCAALSFLLASLGSGLTILHSWELGTEPLNSEGKPLTSKKPDSQFKEVVEDEREWINIRREELKQKALEPTTKLVGIALSGGGIRSATVCLGVLKGLALAKAGADPKQITVLQHVDYMSTVSGGGFAGGALTARLGNPQNPNHINDTSNPKFWEQLVNHFRRCGDYVVPGGAGLNVNTLQPLILLIVGAIANALSLLSFGGPLIVVLHNSETREPKGFLSLAGTWVNTWAQRSDWTKPFVLVPGCHGGVDSPCIIADALPALNLIGAAFAFFVVVFALSVGTTMLGMLFSCHPLRKWGLRCGSYFVLLLLPTWLLLLALRGEPLLTVLMLCMAMGFIVYIMLRHVKREYLLGIMGAVIGGQVFAAFNVSQVHTFVIQLTNLWSGVLEFLLTAPIKCTDRIVSTKFFFRSIPESAAHSDSMRLFGELIVAGLFALVFIGLGFGLSRNFTGLNEFWAAQIANAFLSRKNDSNTAPGEAPSTRGSLSLANMKPGANASSEKIGAYAGAPLHIVTAAVNTPGSTNAILRQRATARFELSPYYVGSSATGYCETKHYDNTMKLSHALAVSAAAVNSQGGQLIPKWARIALTILNCSLGRWLRNPRYAKDEVRFRRWGHFWSYYQLLDIIGQNHEHDSLVFVSDGGHHDNLGLTTLVERECALIICIDAGYDPDYSCEDLAQATRLLRIDHDRSFEWEQEAPTKLNEGAALKSDTTQTSHNNSVPKKRVRVGTFKAKDPPDKDSVVIYAKSALADDLDFDAQNYAQTHPSFPHQSTADQFFDDAQFDAYMSVGESLAREIVTILKTPKNLASEQWDAILADTNATT